MAHSAVSIANAFLDHARADGKGVTPMKLQKLVYYAHGWHLAIFGEPLIDETIEAWKYGPVIQPIYHEFKSFGGNAIDRPGTTFDLDAFEIVEPRPEGDENALALVRKVWDEYSPYSAIQLSDMTHIPGGPWATAREGRQEAKSVPIPNELIQKYFGNLLADNGDANAAQ